MDLAPGEQGKGSQEQPRDCVLGSSFNSTIPTASVEDRGREAMSLCTLQENGKY